MLEKDILLHSLQAVKTKIATIGEISIIPSGGMILRNISKYGSQILPKNFPTARLLNTWYP